MKPKQMVCDWKIAERLKNAGVEQNSMFYWISQPQGNQLAKDCSQRLHETRIQRGMAQ